MSKKENAAKKTGAAAEQPTMQMGALSQIRTLVVINQRKNLDGALAFLERNYYQLHLVSKIPELIKALQIHRPQIVLLSWNLKNADVKRVYRLLTEKFHITTIVFAEDTNTRTTASLMSSGIKQALLAPVSGPSIHMRIQSMLAPKMRPRKRPVAPDLFKKNVKLAKKEAVPKNLDWKQVPDPDVPGGKIWQSFEVRDNVTHIGNLYFFKGEKPPKLDPITQSWELEEGSAGIYIQERVISPEFKAVQKGPEEDEEHYAIAKAPEEGDMMSAVATGSTPLDKDFDWDQAIALAETEINAVQKGSVSLESSDDKLGNVQTVDSDNDRLGNVQSTGGEADLGSVVEAGPAFQSRTSDLGATILAQSLKEAVAKYPGQSAAEFKEKTKFSKMLVCAVVTQRFCGYLVCVSAEDTYRKDFMNHVMAEFNQVMIKNGEPISGDLQILEVEVDAISLAVWTENKADFTIISKTAALSLAFFSTPEQPKIIESQDDSVIGIFLEKDLVPDTTMSFDVFIHLPKNDKYLLYLSKGQTFTKNMLSKFIGFGVKNMFIRRTEKDLFLAYCARNFITSSLK